jgi:hypothetical protein
MFKKLDYNALVDEDHTWIRVKRETYYLGMRTDSWEGKNMIKKLDYNALIDEDHIWNRVKMETYYYGMKNGSMRH